MPEETRKLSQGPGDTMSWWGIMMTALRGSRIGEGTGSREAAVFGMMASMVWDQKVGVEQLAGI
jgi:outer membrane lipoprotein SlyB